jgi:predicted dehydrogenase
LNYKILLIGYGSIAHKHINVLRSISSKISITALRSNHSAHNNDLFTNIFDLKDLRYSPDFIIISNPSYLHEETILKVLHLNSTLFIEKPVTTNLHNTNLILNNISKNKIKSYVACNMRFHPALIWAKNNLLIETIKINEVNIYCGSYLPDWRSNINYKDSYSSKSSMGGGVHLDLIHEIDYCCWLFGKPLLISAKKRNVSTLDISSYDFASYCFIYPNFSVNIILNYYRRDNKRELEILTDNTTYKIDLINNSIEDLLNKNILYHEKFEMFDTYQYQMKYFLDNLNSNIDYENNIEQNLDVLKLALHE